MDSGFSLGTVTVSSSPQERFSEFLQSKGKRITQQRRILVDYVFERHDHFDAEELILNLAQQGAQGAGIRIDVTRDPEEAATDASAIYTDVWASMGQEAEHKQRLEIFQGYKVTPEMMAAASPEAVFMHCLPAHRGEEVSESVMEGEQSIIWDQAENKLHMHKAILDMLISRTL